MLYIIAVGAGILVGLFVAFIFADSPDHRHIGKIHREVVRSHGGRVDPDQCPFCSEEEWP